jgi:hypothetical protein
VFNGGDYWVQDARGVRSAPEEVASQIRATVQRDVVGLLLALADGKLKATRLADINEGGRALAALRVGGAGMQPLTLVLDPATGLVLAERYAVPPGDAVEEQFSDYRNVSGVQVAFSATVKKGGQPFVSRRLHRVEYNVPLDSALFTKPS